MQSSILFSWETNCWLKMWHLRHTPWKWDCLNYGFYRPTQSALTDRSNFIYIEKISLMRKFNIWLIGRFREVLRNGISNTWQHFVSMGDLKIYTHQYTHSYTHIHTRGREREKERLGFFLPNFYGVLTYRITRIQM